MKGAVVRRGSEEAVQRLRHFHGLAKGRGAQGAGQHDES